MRVLLADGTGTRSGEIMAERDVLEGEENGWSMREMGDDERVLGLAKSEMTDPVLG
jgi:hypothetical protein